jgi:hypothetical protein
LPAAIGLYRNSTTGEHWYTWYDIVRFQAAYAAVVGSIEKALALAWLRDRRDADQFFRFCDAFPLLGKGAYEKATGGGLTVSALMELWPSGSPIDLGRSLAGEEGCQDALMLGLHAHYEDAVRSRSPLALSKVRRGCWAVIQEVCEEAGLGSYGKLKRLVQDGDELREEEELWCSRRPPRVRVARVVLASFLTFDGARRFAEKRCCGPVVIRFVE